MTSPTNGTKTALDIARMAVDILVVVVVGLLAFWGKSISGDVKDMRTSMTRMEVQVSSLAELFAENKALQERIRQLELWRAQEAGHENQHG